MTLIKKLQDSLKDVVSDKTRSSYFMHKWCYIILGTVSFIMAIINLCFDEDALMVSTFVFSALCAVDYLFLTFNKKGKFISRVLFAIEVNLLFTFFLVWGAPEGFSAIWICLLPTSGMLLYGSKKGTIVSSIMFIIVVFLLWTPIGRNLLQFEYTKTFIIRFPILYLAFFAVGLFMEDVRGQTYEKLLEAKQKYEELSVIDVLTKVQNRIGFYDFLAEEKRNPRFYKYSVIMLDIDHFKNVNDTYGHENGDVVLKTIAQTTKDFIGTKGTVCRWGGEEFIALLFDVSEPFDFADELREKISKTDMVLIDGRVIHLTVSIGVVICDLINYEKAFNLADICMYEAKNTGRNKVVGKEI